MIKKIRSLINLHLFLLFCISIVLPLIWLPGNKIIAGGDIGIPMLLPQKAFETQSYLWSDANATGNSYPSILTAEPFYFIFSVIDKLGIGPDISQKLLFMVILFGSSLSIYFLSKEFFKSRSMSFLAALFYIFNLNSLSVWQRGIHNAMLMLFLAPLSLLILVWGIKNKNYLSILLINIVSFLLSYVFGALGFVFSLWLLWTLYLLMVLIDGWKDKQMRKFILTYSLILLFSWVGTNSWWIIHLFSVSGSILGQFTADELKSMGSDVVVGLKPFLGAETILRAMSKFYHYYVKDWGGVYVNPFFIFISWIPTLIIFFTVLMKENYKSLIWKFLLILVMAILVISKGVNAPFGMLNKIPYDLFQLLAPLRNPYEKVGILLSVPFSLLFALGTSQIWGILKSKKRHFLNSILVLAVIICLTVLVWPLWLGKLFVSNGKNYSVAIPSYYNEANNWLKGKVAADDTRILHLPLAWGESIDYNWEYTGIEPSQYFFNGSSIGYEIGVASVDTRIRDLLLSVHNQNTVNIQKALASLNVGWVVMHNETSYRDRIIESPERINKWLATAPYFLEHIVDFGPLSIWRVKDQYRLGHIYNANELISLSKIKPQASLNVWNEMTSINDSFFTEARESYQNLLNKYVNRWVVFPIKSFVYSPLDTVNEEVGLKDLAKVNYLPDTFVYPLVLLKENILMFLSQNDPVINCFALSGKRLKEAALLSRQSKFTETKKSLIVYEKQLANCSEINNDVVIAYTKSKQKDLIIGQLVRQKAVLEGEFSNANVSKEGNIARTKLIEYLTNLGLVSKFEPVKLENNKQQIVFHYTVSEDGSYSIKFNKPDQDLIKNPPTITQIDDHSVNLNPTDVSTAYIQYPPYVFNKGFHEIQLQIDFNRNLIEGQVEAKKIHPDLGFTIETDPATQKPIFVGDATNNSIALTFDLSNLDVEQNYTVSFDIYFTQGTPPFLTITHDSDPLNSSGNPIPAVREELKFETYPVQWQHIDIPYTPVLNSTSAKVSVILIPWNDCFANFSLFQCEQMGMFNKADRPTNAKFRNIKIEKAFNNDLVLEKVNDAPVQKIGTVNLAWKKIDPTLYEATLNDQKPPYIIVFSETFNSLWQIMDSNNKEISLPHFTINGFANAWLVEKPLPGKIRIKFVLQDARNEGILISVVAFLILISIVIYLNRRRNV